MNLRLYLGHNREQRIILRQQLGTPRKTPKLVHLEHKKSKTSWHLQQELHFVQHWLIMVRDKRSNFYSNFQPRVERLLAHLELFFRHKRFQALLKKEERRVTITWMVKVAVVRSHVEEGWQFICGIRHRVYGCSLLPLWLWFMGYMTIQQCLGTHEQLPRKSCQQNVSECAVNNGFIWYYTS